MSAEANLQPNDLIDLTEGVIAVGEGGRGFVVASNDDDVYVITAAHCLPQLPPAHPLSYTQERTYPNLLGTVDDRCRVWCECLFADPVSDLCVLCSPDDQSLFDEAEAYEKLTADRPTFAIELPNETPPKQLWLLSLDGVWRQREGRVHGGRWVSFSGGSSTGPDGTGSPGTSGSPIVSRSGRAIAAVSLGPTMNPLLSRSLPGWFIERFTLKKGGA